MNRSQRVFKSIFEGLFASQKIDGVTEQKLYLKRVNELIPPLRTRFQLGDRKNLEVNYAEQDTQAAYLLAFLPDYAKRLRRILKKEPLSNALTHLADRKVVNICSFGAGPCPELAALTAIASAKGYKWKRLNLTAVDLESGWVFSRVLVQNFVCAAQHKELKVVIEPHTLNLCKDKLTKTILEACANADLLVFQNLLNELSDVGHFASLLQEITAAMKDGAHLVVSDIAMLSNYKIADCLDPALKKGQLRSFTGKALQIKRCASSLANSKLAPIIRLCSSLLSNADQPFKYNYLYFVKQNAK